MDLRFEESNKKNATQYFYIQSIPVARSMFGAKRKFYGVV